MERNQHAFGLWLKQRRSELDLTQAELARLVGCSTITIQKIEGGRRRPSRQIAERLAANLGVEGVTQAEFVRLGRAQRREQAPTGHARSPAGQPFVAGISLPLTPFIGRTDELAWLLGQLAEGTARLLTIYGGPNVKALAQLA